MTLQVSCLPYALGKQLTIPLINLGRKWTLRWWWWWATGEKTILAWVHLVLKYPLSQPVETYFLISPNKNVPKPGFQDRAVPDHEFTGFWIPDINRIVNSKSDRIWISNSDINRIWISNSDIRIWLCKNSELLNTLQLGTDRLPLSRRFRISGFWICRFRIQSG